MRVCAGGCRNLIATIANNMLTMDEPDHTRLRGIVDEAFRRRAVLDMEPRIRAIADGLAGDLFAGRPRRPRRSVMRDLAAVGDLRIAGSACERSAAIHRLGEPLSRLTNVIGFLSLLLGFGKMRPICRTGCGVPASKAARA